MSHLEYKSYGGYGAYAKKELHYSQAVRIGDLVEISGQGAWNRDTGSDYPEEIADHVEQAFANVEYTLRLAGADGWDSVFKLHTYHVGMTPESLAAAATCLKKYCKHHEPLWTAIGVEKLAFPEMKIEIEVRAHIKS